MSIEYFLPIIDRLISLTHRREENYRRQFNELAKPLYESTESVLFDYRQLFLNIISAIESGTLIFSSQHPPENSDLLQRFNEERNKFLHIRIKIMELADAIRNSDVSPEIQEVAYLINLLFMIVVDSSDGIFEARTVGIGVVVGAPANNKEALLNFCKLNVDEINEFWGIASKSYAKALIKST